MKDKVDSIMNKIRSNTEVYQRATELAIRSKDESTSVLDRMAALIELNTLIQIVSKDDTLNEPEYKWVNGARVKVK